MDWEASAVPPINKRSAQRRNDHSAPIDKEIEVARTGPKIADPFMAVASIAYAARRISFGTACFHRGRAERLIGGALAPKIVATTKRLVRVFTNEKAISEVA